MADLRIETTRLVLREWRDDDAGAMHAMGQDPLVMAHSGPLMTRDDAQVLVKGQIVNQALFGHCFWPVERKSDGAVIGFCGLNPGPQRTPIADEIEIGWRLRSDVWGCGYATEAAQACLDWAWSYLRVERVAAITVTANTRSRRLMERLGMERVVNGDFDHPDLPVGDPLRRHVLYHVARPAR